MIYRKPIPDATDPYAYGNGRICPLEGDSCFRQECDRVPPHGRRSASFVGIVHVLEERIANSRYDRRWRRSARGKAMLASRKLHGQACQCDDCCDEIPF